MDPDFRKREMMDIVIALTALTLGFSILMARRGGVVDWPAVIALLPYSLVILLFGFLGHELAHRQIARRLGYIAFFQADYLFLPLVVILPLFFGFIFAAPGAVVISPFRLYGRGDERRDIFLISAAGPASNIVFAIVGLLLSGLHDFFNYFAYVNAWLAFFNLLPIPPLDGSKMIRTNAMMWILLFLASGILLWLLW